ncbi:glycosyl transferase family 36, partial [Elusimicrobiota bacterium]
MNNYKNKYGYFDKNGREFVITRHDTPRPWVNVICPSGYGTIISQIGGGYSWLTHAKYNRITNWNQDLLKDNNGKYIFIKDKDTGELWSATWMPVKKEYQEYKCIHGIGYSVFENKTEDIRSTMTVFVPPEDKLEIWKLKIKNESKIKK